MRLKEVRVIDGETVALRSDWTAVCKRRGATVTSSEWEGATSPSLTGYVATAMLGEHTGRVRNTVTLSNGETLIADRWVLPNN
jgi:hypothetical protein